MLRFGDPSEEKRWPPSEIRPNFAVVSCFSRFSAGLVISGPLDTNLSSVASDHRLQHHGAAPIVAEILSPQKMTSVERRLEAGGAAASFGLRGACLFSSTTCVNRKVYPRLGWVICAASMNLELLSSVAGG